MMEEVKKNPPEGFRREYWEKMAENPHRYYIEPDKGTSRESVERARRLIASHQQGRSVRPGQKERDLELAPIGEYRMCQRAVRRLCNPCERCLVRKVARLLAQPLTLPGDDPSVKHRGLTPIRGGGAQDRIPL